MATFESRMSFLEPWSEDKGNPYVRGAAAEGFDTHNYSNLEYAVQVTNARPNKHEFDINTHGFAYVDDPSITEEVLQLLRENDRDKVAKEYYPLVEELVRKETGATRVFVFDHTVRKRDPSLKAGSNPNGREQPASLVHCDQSAVGAIRRVHRHMGDEAAHLLQGRAQIINVWRPLRGPVSDWPLATMDARTLKDAHIHPTNIFKHQYKLQGQTVSISQSPEQRWYYLDQQKVEEVTFIKIWDNCEMTEAKLCAHCAFPHPETPENAGLRESMEVRCLVFYED